MQFTFITLFDFKSTKTILKKKQVKLIVEINYDKSI